MCGGFISEYVFQQFPKRYFTECDRESAKIALGKHRLGEMIPNEGFFRKAYEVREAIMPNTARVVHCCVLRGSSLKAKVSSPYAIGTN
jgi:hypothetical protein